jgi:hypothetical protein
MQSDDKTNPHWAKTPAGKFYRLLFIKPEKLGLEQQSGIVVAWHGGLKPKWIYVDKSSNIARDLDTFTEDDDIMSYDLRGGVFVSWALIRPEYQDGVLKYLLETMTPLIEPQKLPGEKVESLAVLAPGQD